MYKNKVFEKTLQISIIIMSGVVLKGWGTMSKYSDTEKSLYI